MIEVKLANLSHVLGIIEVCRSGYQDVSNGVLSESLIEERCNKYYNKERVSNEVGNPTKEWGGYFVALDRGEVVGAGGGGMIAEGETRLYVLYLDPTRRNEGIGSKILEAITQQQKNFGAKSQYVTVQKDNMKGIPFYEARRFMYVEKIVSNNIKNEPNDIVFEYVRTI
ncbi:GNAT family N-acetyltransferase [Salinicoccus sesuvii]|uniref:GNAT family N-acetyltransferase n=1 Tax=Salinicoccus sesuvii TaxID=868281 RepID=A0ABV7N4N1_9STAP